jgi:hypothetical protein
VGKKRARKARKGEARKGVRMNLSFFTEDENRNLAIRVENFRSEESKALQNRIGELGQDYTERKLVRSTAFLGALFDEQISTERKIVATAIAEIIDLIAHKRVNLDADQIQELKEFLTGRFTKAADGARTACREKEKQWGFPSLISTLGCERVRQIVRLDIENVIDIQIENLRRNREVEKKDRRMRNIERLIWAVGGAAISQLVRF